MAFGILMIGLMVSFAVGGLMGAGWLLFQAGQIWLLFLIARVCRPDALFYALVIPFFTWYFAYQRLDIAKWPLFLSIGGLLLHVVSAIAGV